MGLPKRRRLRRAADFRNTIRQGVRLNGRAFVLIARRAPASASRLGLAVGRRVGSAVVRNRIKRRLREAFRQPRTVDPPMDFVLIVKPEAATCSQAVLALELRRQLERLSSYRNQRG